MGLKALKEHFRIGHIIARYKGEGICIGSSYIHKLIHVAETGEVKWDSALGPCSDENLSRYMAEMSASPETVKRLLAEPDVFSASLPVYTFKDGQVVEEFCEKRGWPNLTHSGELMSLNTHFATPAEAAAEAKSDLSAGIRNVTEHIQECEAKLKERRERLFTMTKQLAALLEAYPSVSTSDQPLSPTVNAA